MGDIKGFMKYDRELPTKRPVEDRVNDYNEIYIELEDQKTNKQAARCMDCGIPFCNSGCPLGNIIPDFNDAVYKEDWKEAYNILSSTNNFPEFTGRICPAPCEQACVLGINNDPVTIEYIEKSIIEKAYNEGWVKPHTEIQRTGKTVAVVGSGPAGMAAADQLNKAGHTVTLFERNDKMGGLLQYGIPDFKLEKWVVERRLQIMEESGVQLRTNTNVGVDITAEELQKDYDAIVLTGGSTIPRDLPIPGRELKGVHFAMDYLEQSNRQVAGQEAFNHEIISAAGKNVVVIGGGDTGADCVGTSNRKKATSVTQIELLSKPPLNRHEDTPWPLWPMQLRTSTSHEEGADRQWAILSKEFVGDGEGNLKALRLVNIEWYFDKEQGRSTFREIAGTQRDIPCELALLAVGFVHPQHKGLLSSLSIDLDKRGNVSTPSGKYATSVDKVFAAGDMRRGQSLVVWAISEGREAAIEVDEFLSGGKTILNSKSYSKLLV
ncbi:MAG: glutamate synthase (NADPH/NADH) small chain [Saprospiraceae bacterium]|jgi:glutamate synthase (NADPH/NADH) small chain